MSLQERSATERVLEARARYVARGVSTPAIVVDRAAGARIWDVDGKEYLDFAGGIGCVNLGHCHTGIVAAIHEQVDRYLHQCFMVGTYEPYVDVCRLLAELSPCRGASPEQSRAEPATAAVSSSAQAPRGQKSILLNSGAEAIENAVKIARAATGRPGVVVFDNAFHGRTLLTMTMTSKTVYKVGGPFAPEVYRAPAPYPYRGVSSDDAIHGLELLFKTEVDPQQVACVVLEPVQGEGGFLPMPADFPARLRELCDAHGILWVDDEVQSGVGRTGPVWAIEHYLSRDAPAKPPRPSLADSVEPTSAGAEPDLLVAGKSLGGGLPLASVTGRAELMDAIGPGGLGGTFGGNPVACAAAVATLEALPGLRERADWIGARAQARLEKLAAREPAIGEVRGLGPMLALEFVDQTPERASATVAAARERGLVLLTCGLYGNVIRLHVPLVISDEDLDRGLEILEESIGDAGRGA